MTSTGRFAKIERWLTATAILLAVIGALVCVQPELFPTADQRQVRRIVAALESRAPDVLQLASEYMVRSQSTPFAVALAAEAAAVKFEHKAAIQRFQELPADGGRWELVSQLGLARRLEVLGQTSAAERHLRRALELDPWHIEANTRLTNLLQQAGRTWEAIPYSFLLIRRGKCRGDELAGFAATESFFQSDERLETIGLNSDPPEVMAQLAVARRLMYDNEHAAAESLLRSVVQAAPQLGEAQGRLGRIIFNRGDLTEFLHWRGGLPEDARTHPEVWYVQGMQARRLGQTEGALRCFLEALKLSPNHLGANIQIASCLDQLNRSELAKRFVRRSDLLSNLDTVLNLLRNDADPELIRKAVANLTELGRFWEAAGWTYVMTHLHEVPKHTARAELRHLLTLCQHDSKQIADAFNPVNSLHCADFREPDWAGFAVGKPANTDALPDLVEWALQDDAERVGIQFQYFEGTTEANRLQHIFNVVGGGLAAMDYDLDGWVDLYLAQGNNWRDPRIQPEHSDCLYRNLLGQGFADVSALTGLGDLGFTHGVAVGDFDQDGFPDIYLGNLGPNRLYRNNGDGTFSDVTAVADVAGNEWTTSSVLADFNGDGLPDLYVANYSVREATAAKECKRSNGEPMACTPNVLEAEFHRLYLNAGDGTFRDVTQESGMRQPNGRGLGLVAWDFGSNGRLGLFVGNDTSPNFLYMNQQTRPDGIPQFHEDAVVRGVAYDADGNAQACMGVATGDADGDGQIDMYVTNFFGESDTLYSQHAEGHFEDSTRRFNLRDAGFWTLGFGTQFIDFDGDGWEDLIATNGHVDQQSRRGDPDRTPPQLFRNLQGRKFAEVSPDRLGPFFQRGYLGRGLARMDWNRDGRLDFAVSHIHDKFALVTNKTPSTGQSLIVRLIGRSGTREPTGAVVKVRLGDRDCYRFATAGDGYLVTNERLLHVAVPSEHPTVSVEVRWPGGMVEHWDNVRPGGEILLIEGRSQPIVLNTFRVENIISE